MAQDLYKEPEHPLSSESVNRWRKEERERQVITMLTTTSVVVNNGRAHCVTSSSDINVND